MKSSFTIDFADLNGEGIEPIIRVQIGDETVEDKLLKTLFQSIDTHLFVSYHNQVVEDGQLNSSVVLSKSEVKFKF